MDNSSFVSVAIIGAGVGGISTAVTLQTQLGSYDYEIYEMTEGIGGTWLENTYPGCACDVPSHWYSLSTEPNPDWSQMFSGHKEIRAYWEGIASKHNIRPHIRFHNEVLSATWDEDLQLYTMAIRDVRNKEIRHVRARVVVSAVGVFHKPRWPEIPGQSLFTGISMHARMWDHSVGFSGKRVAIIGNGCSATQIVAELSKDQTTEIINFCRTPSWFVPRPQAVIPSWVKWTFRNVPLTGILFRWALAARLDIGYHSWKTGRLTTALRRWREKGCIEMIKKLAPQKYHKNLIPDYPMGCKRIIVDPGYLEALQRPNLELEWEPISKITEKGIVVKSGKSYEFDIICYATGFDVEHSDSIKITGLGGKTMGEYFTEQGGPTAYMGTTTPGFPNWFTLFGPNTTTGHGSVIFSEEVQINYAMQLIAPIIQGKAKSFVPKSEATDKYNDFIQTELKRTVWTSCVSWYRAGDSRQGKLIATWPATLTYMWWLMRTPIWSDYETTGGESWLQKRRRLSVLKSMMEVTLAGAALGAFFLQRKGKWDMITTSANEYVRRLVG